MTQPFITPQILSELVGRKNAQANTLKQALIDLKNSLVLLNQIKKLYRDGFITQASYHSVKRTTARQRTLLQNNVTTARANLHQAHVAHEKMFQLSLAQQAQDRELKALHDALSRFSPYDLKQVKEAIKKGLL